MNDCDNPLISSYEANEASAREGKTILIISQTKGKCSALAHTS